MRAADRGAAMVVALVVLLIAETRARLQLLAEPAGAGIRLLREVHSLKRGAGTVALPPLGALARALEAQVGRRAQETLPRYRLRSMPD
ncbi:MAG TPA: Hpt domain-containing protein [Acetobacteraceae bacterium]|nr:Hpt domain-containing protein [Acetobacteraceae bacterium]